MRAAPRPIADEELLAAFYQSVRGYIGLQHFAQTDEAVWVDLKAFIDRYRGKWLTPDLRVRLRALVFDPATAIGSWVPLSRAAIGEEFWHPSRWVAVPPYYAALEPTAHDHDRLVWRVHGIALRHGPILTKQALADLAVSWGRIDATLITRDDVARVLARSAAVRRHPDTVASELSKLAEDRRRAAGERPSPADLDLDDGGVWYSESEGLMAAWREVRELIPKPKRRAVFMALVAPRLDAVMLDPAAMFAAAESEP